MSYPLSDLDIARMNRTNAAAELDALALEQRATGRNIVQGVYYADQDRADKKRGEITERCMRDLDRLDATIARMALEDSPVECDAHAWTFTYDSGPWQHCDDCGADHPDNPPHPDFPEDVGGYDPDAVIDAEWHAREADEMRRESSDNGAFEVCRFFSERD